MGKDILVVGKRLLARGGSCLVTLAVVATVSACGDDSNDRTGETRDRSDGSVSNEAVDGGRDAGQAALGGDASLANPSSHGATSEPDAGAVSANSNPQSAASVSTASNATSTTNTTVGTDVNATSDGTESGLRPGWVAIEPITEDLSDCSAKLEQNDEWCSYSAVCGILALGSRCELLDGEWHCTCEPNSSEREYRLTGIDGTNGKSACEAGVVLCAPRGPQIPTPTCETQIEELSDQDCKASEQCRSPVQLEDGVSATVVEHLGSSTCSMLDDGTMTCTCGEFGDTAPVFELSLEQACTGLVPWCKTGFPDVSNLPAELICTGDTFTQNDGFCRVERSCGSRMDVSTGYAILNWSSQGVQCEAETGCSCFGHDYIFAQATGDIAGERCEVMGEFCYSDVTAVATGTVSVSATEVQGSDNSCTGTATAKQWASWDDEKSAELTGYIAANCEHEEATTWRCTCGSGLQVTEAFDVEGLDSQSTCEETLDHCVARAQLAPAKASQFNGGFTFEFAAEAVDADAGP